MLDSKVLNTDYDLAEMIDLCLPNLLDNADFKSGIINQRGQDSYTGSASKNVYTIDRWSINTNTANTLSVEEGYISCTLADNGLLTQYIDSEISGAITCVIKLKDEDLKVVTVSEYSSENEWESLIYDFGELETGLNVKVVKDISTINKWRLRFQNLSGSNKTLNIEYIKLEKGSVFTGMPQWDFALEWFKCQRYLYIVVNSSILNARYDGSNLCINFKTPMSFVNKPSIIHNNAIFGVTSFNGSYENHNVSDFTVNTYDGGNINIIKPSSNPTRYGMAIVVNGFYLDAEIY